MNNDLKNFLERETQNITQYAYFVDHQSEEDLAEVVREHNTRLINFVLDLVQKEVENIENPYSSLDSEWYEGAECMRRDISTVINSLVAYALNVKIGF